MTVKVGEPCPTCGHRQVSKVCDGPGCDKTAPNIMPKGWLNLENRLDFCSVGCLETWSAEQNLKEASE